MTRIHQGPHSTQGRTKKESTTKTPAVIPLSITLQNTQVKTPLEVVFNDVLSRQVKRESTADRRKRQLAPAGGVSEMTVAPTRVALYIRVSGDKSVRSDLSMPDQEIQLRKFCEQQKWLVVAVYYEPGKSAKSTARKEFRRMIADAFAEGDPPFNKILVHNTSRFARSSKDYDIFEALLHERSIAILAITQTFSKDAGGMVALRMTNLMDEFYSLRSAVDSTRARVHMVGKGYWPGGTPPYGYRCTPSPENRQRSLLEVHDEERVIVEQIYSMALFGDGNGPPMGVKSIVVWLNDHGYRTRMGSRWSTQAIHRMLTQSIYYGEYFWGVNQNVHQFQQKYEPPLLKVRPIVSRADFDRVQEMLERRNPRMSGAKLVSSPLLLAGIAKCACGASMTLGTGTGKLGRVYRYYRCSSDARGTNAHTSVAPHERRCSRPRVAEKDLDTLVLEQVRDRVLAQDRLIELLTRLRDREMLAREQENILVPQLRARITAAETALSGLFAVAKQIPSISDQRPYQADVAAVSVELRTANQMLADLLRRTYDHAGGITPESVDLFRNDMLEVLFGENRAIAKIYLTTIVAVVIVGERTIDIQGHISDLAFGVAQARERGLEASDPRVRTYERRWRKRWDSNPRYGLPHAGFQDRFLKPLGHSSIASI